MWEDPVVEEIRRIRAAHSARFGYDLDAIFQEIKRCESESGRQYVNYPARRIYAPSGVDLRGEAVSEPSPGEDTE